MEGEAPVRYRAVASGVVRSGAALDSSLAFGGRLAAGAEIVALERAVLGDGAVRLRYEGGWVSERAQSGKLLLERVGAGDGSDGGSDGSSSEPEDPDLASSEEDSEQEESLEEDESPAAPSLSERAEEMVAMMGHGEEGEEGETNEKPKPPPPPRRRRRAAAGPWAIALAERADVAALVSLINGAYASAEGDLWAEGEDFKRTEPPEIERLIDARELYVARTEAGAAAAESGGGGGGDGSERAIAGCVSCSVVQSTAGGRAAEVLEFGLLCVAPAHKRGGLATHLINHSEGVAKARGQKRMQCELLVPRDLEAHPHPFKEMMLKKFCAAPPPAPPPALLCPVLRPIRSALI